MEIVTEETTRIKFRLIVRILFSLVIIMTTAYIICKMDDFFSQIIPSFRKKKQSNRREVFFMPDCEYDHSFMEVFFLLKFRIYIYM